MLQQTHAAIEACMDKASMHLESKIRLSCYKRKLSVSVPRKEAAVAVAAAHEQHQQQSSVYEAEYNSFLSVVGRTYVRQRKRVLDFNYLKE